MWKRMEDTVVSVMRKYEFFLDGKLRKYKMRRAFFEVVRFDFIIDNNVSLREKICTAFACNSISIWQLKPVQIFYQISPHLINIERHPYLEEQDNEALSKLQKITYAQALSLFLPGAEYLRTSENSDMTTSIQAEMTWFFSCTLLNNTRIIVLLVTSSRQITLDHTSSLSLHFFLSSQGHVHVRLPSWVPHRGM